jgi:two-component system, OmpR family, copper resistance phosphate regulon response regulator CusR
MKILLVEDEPKVASFIKEGLEEENHEVTVVYDGHFGYKMATENRYDLIVLDLMIPYINGLDLCRQLRDKKINTSILMLTALGSIDDKVTGLDAGADDYLVKPFEFKELSARVRALSKRTSPNGGSDAPILAIADLTLNNDSKIAKRGDKIIDLTAKEFLLLEYFLRNKGRVISRAEIAEKVWGINFDTGTNVIDVYVNFLRKKIDKEHPTKLIHTIIGMGYTMRVEQH